MSYILAIDQGTSSTKTTLFDAQGTALFKAAEPLKTHYLDGNRVEQEPEVIYQNFLTSVKKCLDGFKSNGGDIHQIKACGISNQRFELVSNENGSTATSVAKGLWEKCIQTGST